MTVRVEATILLLLSLFNCYQTTCVQETKAHLSVTSTPARLFIYSTIPKDYAIRAVQRCYYNRAGVFNVFQAKDPQTNGEMERGPLTDIYCSAMYKCTLLLCIQY